MLVERKAYIVWLKQWQAAKQLDTFGDVHYVSSRFHYAVLYVDAKEAETACARIRKLPTVRQIEPSYRNQFSEMGFREEMQPIE